ncbi:MAG: SDR family NAD(P)-dependent oxidoreductase, partial [Gammaproteobacteria bacterium]
NNLKKKYKDDVIDILLNNAAYTPRYFSSFRGIGGVDIEATRKSFEVNTIGTMKVIQTFIDNVERSKKGKIVNLSTKAASFEERPEIPMMYSYAMSKAALNSMIKTLSFETLESEVIVVALSPGIVNTTLGMGFMGAIEIDESVSKMMVVIENLTMDQNGLFLDYEDGRVIGW